ncbi:hypothetical protein GS610_06700 [Ruegeria sp. HKCCD6228]|uniref:hypothetical protein n=1 Tax=Ruegeria sp. HKCCD6228 TaxID=2683001 RepID=UPI0014925A20|nr:hypothetical protein [Ruegeria sp. HKCCD6228]NOD96895.1 hypothetical protein [Ruegeria sp. HKCCD6228]
MTDTQDTDDNNDGGSIWDLFRLIGFGVVCYFIYLIFFTDPRGDQFNELVETMAPADQKVFLDIVGSAIETADSASNDAAATSAYIAANEQLCSSQTFNPVSVKTGWVGIFDGADLTDSSSKMYVDIDIGHDNEIRAEVPEVLRDTVLNIEDGKSVLFSGTFEPGNMYENQCLDTIGSVLFGAKPKLTDRQFTFDLRQIAEIAE